MAAILEPTPEMGEYGVNLRSESFVLHGEDSYDGKRRHAIFCYPNEKSGQGSVEILIEDIPKIRAALDLVETAVGIDEVPETVSEFTKAMKEARERLASGSGDNTILANLVNAWESLFSIKAIH